MKKFLLIAALSGLVAFAADKAEMIKGKAECAKCSLKETDSCQMAITTKDGTKYLVENNKVAKDFHSNICKGSKDVEITGTIEEKGGKKMIKAKKIEAKS